MTRSLRMPISVVDELAAASGLTAEEYGAYMLLRIHQWQHGSLPRDDDRLSRIAHVTPARWQQVVVAIRPQFDENWRHEATHQTRQESQRTRQRLSEAGQKGASSKRTGKPVNGLASAFAASQAEGIASDRATSQAGGPASGQPARETRSPTTAQHDRQAGSLAMSGLKPDFTLGDSDAASSVQPSDNFPPVTDPTAAREWLLERHVFPGDLDELIRLLVAGELTPAILARSAP